MDNSSTGKSALGMEGNITALLGYIINIVALISVFIEKDNKFVRFHALQSVFWSLGLLVLLIATIFIGMILTFVLGYISSTLGGLVFGLTMLLYVGLFIVFFGGAIYAAIQAYGGKSFKFPIIGNLAEKYT
ncbi:MAG: DUF4870 domain-containing protein [Pyrinomonadaceae bacterium]